MSRAPGVRLPWSRAARRFLLPALALTLVVVTLAPRDVPESALLYQEGVRLAAPNQPEAVPSGADASEAGPLWEGAVPGEGTRWEPVARRALADLDVLTLEVDLDGDPATRESAVLAGWHRSWRYVWPRDASFAAAALAEAGRHDDAVAVLRFLQNVQSDDGTFQARYRADGTVPDDRGTQLDSTGWVLWAAWTWLESAREAELPEHAVQAVLAELRPLMVRSATAAADSVHPGTGLPHPSPDYWEVPLRETSLGTAAPVLVGLRAAAVLLPQAGEHDAGARSARVATLVEDGVTNTFGRRGYPRLVSTRQLDASVAFLMPPFTAAPRGQADAWERARLALTTPAGGLRPGVEFKDPEVSWTPQTALFAMTAAEAGDHDTATGYLDWLARHTTAVGSLPEKVDATGLPAAVAPLSWTACLVLLTLASLDGGLPAPPPAPGRLTATGDRPG